MKVHIVSYNLGQKKISKSRIHILPNYGRTDSKTAIVICKRKEFKLFQLLESFKKKVPMHRPSIKKSVTDQTVVKNEIPNEVQNELLKTSIAVMDSFESCISHDYRKQGNYFLTPITPRRQKLPSLRLSTLS